MIDIFSIFIFILFSFLLQKITNFKKKKKNNDNKKKDLEKEGLLVRDIRLFQDKKTPNKDYGFIDLWKSDEELFAKIIPKFNGKQLDEDSVLIMKPGERNSLFVGVQVSDLSTRSQNEDKVQEVLFFFSFNKFQIFFIQKKKKKKKDYG